MTVDNQSSPVKMEDKFYMTYILFYSLGTAVLIPSNFFITATDYWMFKFRDPNNHPSNETFSSGGRTELQAQFISDYSIVTHVGSIGFMVVTIAFARKWSLVKRLIGGLSGAVIMFAITCMFVGVDTDSWQIGFFIVTLLTGFVLTAFYSQLMVTIFQLVSKFPAGYLAAVLNGQALCGIFAALVQISSLSIGASSKTSGLVYFSIGMFFIFITLLGFLATMTRSQYFKYHFKKEVVQVETPKIIKELFISILKKIRFYISAMVIVMGSTIMIHPGVTSLVVSVNKGSGHKWNDVYFVPVVTFLLYHVADYIGRELARVIEKPCNSTIILVLSICRVAFVPMLMFCNAHPRAHLQVIFDEDYAYIIFILIFAFSNGYLMNLCVIRIVKTTTEEEKNIALVFILGFMLISVGACSFLTVVFVKAL
jgi:equilibrative nucleoside transporter 1/2/3